MRPNGYWMRIPKTPTLKSLMGVCIGTAVSGAVANGAMVNGAAVLGMTVIGAAVNGLAVNGGKVLGKGEYGRGDFVLPKLLRYIAKQLKHRRNCK